MSVQDVKDAASAPIRKHPNASLAGTAVAPSVLIVWLAGHFGLNLGAEEAAVVATMLSSILLVIGRRGIRGIISAVWRGFDAE